MGNVLEFRVRTITRKDIVDMIRKKSRNAESSLLMLEEIEDSLDTSHLADFPEVCERELIAELRGVLKACRVPEWMVNSYIVNTLGYGSNKK